MADDIFTQETVDKLNASALTFNEVVTSRAGGVSTGSLIDQTLTPLGEATDTLKGRLDKIGTTFTDWGSAVGGTLTSAAQAFLNNTVGSAGFGNYYAWTGAFPHIVTPGLDPAATAGYAIRSNAQFFSAVTQTNDGASVSEPSLDDLRDIARRDSSGYTLVGNSTIGCTLTGARQTVKVLATGKEYEWTGSFDKVVTPNDITVGVGAEWVERADGSAITYGCLYDTVRKYIGDLAVIRVSGRSNVFDGAHGVFVRDDADTTSADDGGYCLIDSLGRRWKRQYTGPVDMGWWVDANSNDIQTDGVQAAIDFTASLSGDQHDTHYTGSNPTPPAFYQQYGASRSLKWCASKIRVDDTITLKNTISVQGEMGGLLADESWPDNRHVLDQDWNPYSGMLVDLIIDCNETLARGVRCRSAACTFWDGIKVVAVRDDGFTHLDGPECIIGKLEVVTSLNPVSRQVAGFKSFGADSNYNNIICRFSPVGIWQQGGGNNHYHNAHPWGLYTKQKMYIGFYIKDSSGNQFSMCYSDSPTKADYTQAANATLGDGFINGGYGWLFTGTSRDNVLGGDCHCFVNETDYLNAGNPNAPHLWMVGFHSGLPNTVDGLTERPGSFFWNTTFEYLNTADRVNARIGRAVRSERRRLLGNTQSTGWRHATGFGQKMQNLGNVSGNWAVNFSNGCHVKLNTTASTTLQVSGWPASDTEDTAAEVSFYVTGTNAPSFNVNTYTPGNVAIPTPSARGLILKATWDPVMSRLIFHTVTNL